MHNKNLFLGVLCMFLAVMVPAGTALVDDYPGIGSPIAYAIANVVRFVFFIGMVYFFFWVAVVPEVPEDIPQDDRTAADVVAGFE